MDIEQKNHTQAFVDEESSFDIREWLHYFLQHWYLFLCFVILFIMLIYAKNRRWMPLYETAGTIIMAENKYLPQNQFFLGGFNVGGYQNVNDQLVILNSYDLIGKVVDSLEFMKVDYLTIGRFKTRNIYRNTPIYIQSNYISPDAYQTVFKIKLFSDNSFIITPYKNKNFGNFNIEGHFGEPIHHNLFFITVNKLTNIPYSGEIEMYFKFRTRKSLINEFSSRLSSKYVMDGSSVLRVSLVGETAERDIDFLNKLFEVFLNDNLAKKNDVANKTIYFINEQLDILSQSLVFSENKLTSFKQSNQIIDISSHASEIINKLNFYEEKNNQIKLKETYLNYLSDYLKTNFEEGKVIAPSNLGLNEPILMQLVQQINDLYLQRSELSPKNIYYEKYTNEIENVKTAIFELIKSIRTSLKIEKDENNRQIALLNNEMKKLPEKELAMNAIERDYKLNDNYYTFLLQKKAEAEIQKASNSPDNSVLENARIISITNNKEKSKTTTRYLILAFLIPSLIIVLKKSLNNTITSITDIEKKSSFPVIGVVLHTKNDDPLLCAKYPNSLFSEMFRIIRTRIEFIAQRKKNIVVLVTSLTSEDGKTFFSTNLAAIYGMTGEKTLLIDMDIRKPSVNKRLNVSHPKGVTNYLIGECTLPEIINKIDNVNFDIIFAGTVPPNPGELIRSEKLIKMFEELKKQYDYIIIDVSPVGLVSDTYSLVPLSDVNLLVVRNKKTNKTFFKNIATQLMEDHIQNFYVILNDVDTSYGGYEKSYKYHMYDKKTDNKYYDMIDEI